MFFSKVNGQSHDLQIAKKRNQELKAKELQLIKERDILENKIKTNSVQAANINKNLLVILNEVPKQRKKNSHNAKALDICREMNDFINSSLDSTNSSYMSSLCELDSISEKLSVTDHQKLLEELIERRLKIAEQDDVITELKNEQRNLEQDVQDLRCQDPNSVRHFQEEYMEYKIREGKVLREFQDVKGDIENLKREMNLVLAENIKEKDDDQENLVIRLKFWGQDTSQIEKLKTEKDEVLERITDLKYEAELTRQKIDILTRDLKECQSSRDTKEKIQRNLSDKVKELLQEEQVLINKISKVREEHQLSQNHYLNHLNDIKESVEEKENVINRLSTVITELTNEIQARESQNSFEAERETTDLLELNVVNLMDEISFLKNI